MCMRYNAAHYVGRAGTSVMADLARHVSIKPKRESGLRLNGFISGEGELAESIVLPALQDATSKPDLTLPHSARGFEVWSCDYAHPHTDEVVGDISIGLVISGDHEIYTGLGKRTRFALQPGVVYLLNNKRLHGASRVSQNGGPLVFASKDMVFESVRDAVYGLGLR